MTVSRIVLAFSAVCLPGTLILSATSAAAQPGSQNEPTATAAGETPEQARVKLNTEQAAAAKAQLDQNAASAAAYAAAVKTREDEIARQQADHDAAIKAHDDAVARQKAEYDAAMKQWQEDVAACKAGKKDRCAHPAKKPAKHSSK